MKLSHAVIAVLVVVALLLTMTSSAASAHTQDEYDTWVQGWEAEVFANGGLTMSALGELHEMQDRHPCIASYCAPAPVTQVTAKETTAKKSYAAGVEQWRGLVATYWPADAVDRALRIMSCESGGNPNAKNPNSSARGLFQIMASVWADHFGVSYETLYDPETNIRLGAKILAQQGWGAWVCRG